LQAGYSPERLYMGMESRGLFAAPGEQTPQSSREVPAPRSSALPARFQEYIDGFRSNKELPRLTYYPGLTAKPFHDAKDFSIAHDLERSAGEIKAEFDRLEVSLFHDEAEDIRREGRWSVLFLNERGQWNQKIRERCPVTASLIESHRQIASLAGVS